MKTKQAIIQNALQFFAVHGYQGASMALIAKESQITKSSIYSYFNSKEDLYLAVLDHLLEFHYEYWDRRKKSIRKTNTKKALSDILYTAYTTSNKEKFISIFWQTALIVPPIDLKDIIDVKLKLAKEVVITYLESIFQMGIETGQIEPEHEPFYLASAYYCLLEGATLSHVYDAVPEKEQLLQTIFDTFWRGLEPTNSNSNLATK
ncbi:TetR/AcrR family transcriptional regulator [Halobacillus sp. GSS1]|uniref:TetR/AcrR family transcriptional regulator n=1 Tax=Halobacillus sp. GSS1 TaxID=2815919 RepID=UPI001A903F88|nr:TetR/AcrR family transcriptional regulator [Halobacillus sp. GSS1]MBN9654165.1 TetR/AcrR family transcriptional regulator [Halobacillus sp. GSS1]